MSAGSEDKALRQNKRSNGRNENHEEVSETETTPTAYVQATKLCPIGKCKNRRIDYSVTDKLTPAERQQGIYKCPTDKCEDPTVVHLACIDKVLLKKKKIDIECKHGCGLSKTFYSKRKLPKVAWWNLFSWWNVLVWKVFFPIFLLFYVYMLSYYKFVMGTEREALVVWMPEPKHILGSTIGWMCIYTSWRCCGIPLWRLARYLFESCTGWYAGEPDIIFGN